MPLRDSLLAEYDHETATTRRLLARIPEAELGWRPHQKSMSLGELAGHLANLPQWCIATLTASSFDVSTATEDLRPRAPGSIAELLQKFDAGVRAAREALAAAGDDDMLAPWTLKQGAQEIFTLPRISTLRSFVMNHMIHHRGQLSVYLRLKDVPLPPIYGPTADEA